MMGFTPSKEVCVWVKIKVMAYLTILYLTILYLTLR